MNRHRLPANCAFLLALFFTARAPVSAQLPDQSTAVYSVSGETVMEWFSYEGRTYFIQVSAEADPLNSWVWAPSIEGGIDDVISYEFGGDVPRGFARLQYTDSAKPEGVTLDDWDIDGDGSSNKAEIEGIPQSNPLMFSSSGTGISDSWAIAHGVDPNDPEAAGALFGNSGLTNLQAYNAGVQANPAASPDDLDGDGLDNDEDADPQEVVIDWSPGARPAFGIFDLPVADVDAGIYLDDFTGNGTVLLSRVENHAFVGRIVVDKTGIAHPLDWGSSPITEGDFAAYGGVIMGDQIPGFQLVDETSNESLWDPEADTYSDFEWPGAYHDDMRDDREGRTIWNGIYWPAFPAGDTYGLRVLPGDELLPGSLALIENGAENARVEENGNIISDWAYWRWNLQTEQYDPPAALTEWTWCRSATLAQPPIGVGTARQWNVVATSGGLMVAKDGGAFRKATGALAGNGVRGVTRQGWIWKIEGGVSGIRANGEWRALKEWLGDPAITEAELWDIHDNGLAIARIRKGESAPKLALLLPVELYDDREDAEGDEMTIQGMERVPEPQSDEPNEAF